MQISRHSYLHGAYCITAREKPRTYLVVLPHLTRDVISMLQLINEAVASVVNQQATNTSERLCSEELDFRIGVFGVDETGGVDLNFLHVDALGADGHGHLVTITGAVVTVGGGLTISTASFAMAS